MNNKPDESILISYLYGELNAVENAKVVKYLNENPETMAMLHQLSDAKNLLHEVQDQEVIAPPIFTGDHVMGSLWKSSFFRMSMGMAASIVLILVVGRLLGTEIYYSGGELRVNFGGVVKERKQPVGLTEELVKSMITASLEKNNALIQVSKDEDQKRLELSIRKNLDVNSRKIDGLMKNAAFASQDQMRLFVASLQDGNLKLMKDYLQLSSTDQKKYMEGLLVDFSKYLQEQRKQDMIMFQTRINSVEKNTDIFKQETEHILASIIANPEVTRSKNSY